MDAGLLGFIGTLVAAGGLYFTAISYREGQKWKRAELARQLVERLSTDDELAFCTRALDWGIGPLVIPQKHRPLFPDDRIVMEHDLDVLRDALHPGLLPGWREPEALTYRHSFDAFFTYLLRVADQVTSEHVSKEQLVGLDYYLDLVARPLYLAPKDDGEGKGTSDGAEPGFRPFVERYYPNLTSFIWSDRRHRIEGNQPSAAPESLPAR